MEQYKSKVDFLYESLLKSILSCEFQPGEKIIIRRVSAKYEVSETPVREALNRLTAKGYVVQTANKSFIVNVKVGNAKNLQDVLEIRGILESYATRAAIDILTDKDYDALTKINDRLQAKYEKGQFSLCAKINDDFHFYIFKSLPNKLLCDTIYEFLEKWSYTKTVYNFTGRRIAESIKDHYEIIRLMREKNGTEVEKFVRLHNYQSGIEMFQGLK
ncbi:MAG: GntR family transcriptional regulator [Hydrogenoanaerobacterium sp.]